MVEPRTAEAHHRTAVVKPQVHQTQSVISTNILVLQPTTVALLAVSRETPEKLNSLPVGGYLMYLQMPCQTVIIWLTLERQDLYFLIILQLHRQAPAS